MSPNDSTTLARTTPPTTLEPPRPSADAASVATLGMVNSVDLLAQRVESLRRVANVLSPFGQRPGHLADSFAISMVVVQFDPAVDTFGNGTDVYRGGFMKADQRAPTKVGLRKLSSALGIEWLAYPACRRTDDGRRPHYAEFTVMGVYRTFDGTVQNLVGTAAIDFSDGSEQIGGWTPSAWAALMAENQAALRKGTKKDDLDWQIGGWSEQRVRSARQKVLERAETAAQNRAIRSIGLKHVYTLEELRKPFVCFRMTFVPDRHDPEIKRLMTLNYMGSLAALYPTALAAPPALTAPVEAAYEAPRDPAPEAVAGPAPADAPASTTSSTSTAAASSEPARTVRRVMTTGLRATGDGAFVVLDGGEIVRAADDVAAAAADVQRAQRGVYVVIESRAEEAWLIELEYAPSAQAPPVGPAVPSGETVTMIETRTGASDRGPWTLYKIQTSAGKTLSTFNDRLGTVAVQARDRQLPIRYEALPSEKYPGQHDLKAIRIDDGTEPDLPFEGDTKY